MHFKASYLKPKPNILIASIKMIGHRKSNHIQESTRIKVFVEVSDSMTIPVPTIYNLDAG